MADLGTIGTQVLSLTKGAGQTVPYQTRTTINVIGTANLFPDKKVSGSTQVAGVNVANHRFVVYDKTLDRIVRIWRSDGSGNFAIPFLYSDASRYAFIMFDEGDTGAYNARIVDLVTAT